MKVSQVINSFDPPKVLQTVLESTGQLHRKKYSIIKTMALKKPTELSMHIFIAVLNATCAAREVFVLIAQVPPASLKLVLAGARKLAGKPLCRRFYNKLFSFSDCGSTGVRIGAQSLGILSSVAGIVLFWDKGSEVNIRLQTVLHNYTPCYAPKTVPLQPITHTAKDLPTEPISTSRDENVPPTPPPRAHSQATLRPSSGRPPPIPPRRFNTSAPLSPLNLYSPDSPPDSSPTHLPDRDFRNMLERRLADSQNQQYDLEDSPTFNSPSIPKPQTRVTRNLPTPPKAATAQPDDDWYTTPSKPIPPPRVSVGKGTRENVMHHLTHLFGKPANPPPTK